MKRNEPGRQHFGGKHAVVIGGSIGGLLAAAALSRHFEAVTILERDQLPDRPECRRGVPQARHTHVVLRGGYDVLEDYFPGIWEELLRAGGQVNDIGHDWCWFHFGVWKARPHTDLRIYMQSRPFLDMHVRRRLLQRPNVTIRQECEVRGLLYATAQGRVYGVRLRQRTRDGAMEEEELRGDLVVDASGRGTHMPRWLKELGYGRVPEKKVWIDIQYASRFVTIPEDPARDWKVMLVYGKAPHETRIGCISPVEPMGPMEDARWMITLAGYHGDHPPTDEEGFLAFARGLPRPEYFRAIQDARPLSPIQSYKMPCDLRRYYEDMKRFPDGLVVIGDAICSFNPIFGQGMTTAALGAKTLDRCLAEQPPGNIHGLSRRFQKQTRLYNDVAWRLATTDDMRYPQSKATFPGLRLLNWYKGMLLELSSRDEDVALRFLQVIHFQRGLGALFAPGVIARVLRWALGKRLGTRRISPEIPRVTRDSRSEEQRIESPQAGGL